MIRKTYITIDETADADLAARVRAVGIREVARKAKISPGLVSLFISGKTAIAKPKYEMILRAIRGVSIEQAS